MKKIIYVLLAGAMLTISSCAKDGVNGTNGTNGTNASTAFQLQSIVQANGWNQVGTSGTAGAFVYAQFNSPYLSFDSVGTGAVLVYKLGITNLGFRSYDELPWIHYNSSGAQFTEQYNWNDGAIAVDMYNSLYTFTTFSNPDTFNIVVIPGLKSLPAGVDRNNYASVEAYYHPRHVK